MKKTLKRILAFILICTIFTVSLSHEEQKTAHAVAGVDDAAIVGLIITGVSLVLGTAGIASAQSSGSSPFEIFEDMFPKGMSDTLYDYVSEVDPDKAYADYKLLEAQSFYLALAAKKTKAQYKFPVEKCDDGGYKSYDLRGNVIYVSQLEELFNINGINERAYYLVDSLDTVPFTVNTSGERVLKKDVYDDIAKACSAVNKTTLSLEHAVVDWFKDKTKVGVSDTVDVSGYDYLDKFGDNAKPVLSSYFGDSTFCFIELIDFDRSVAFSWNGVLLELHSSSGVYYSIMTPERFEALNNAYSNTGNLAVLTDNMSEIYSIFKPAQVGDEGVDNTNGGQYYNWSSSYILTLYNDVNSGTMLGSNHGLFPVAFSNVRIFNNGTTGNYVIGNVGADGTITYDVVGETTTSNYLDSLDKGDSSVRVNGDVVVSQKILDAINEGTATVEDINEDIAAINDSVRVVDQTVNNGFNKSNDLLSRILSALLSIPELIFEAFLSLFETLFGYLSNILSAIFGIPIDIVGAIEHLEDIVASLSWSDIIELLEEAAFLNPVLGVLSNILSGVLDIPGVITNVFDGIKALPEAIASAIAGAIDFVISIPGEIYDAISSVVDAIEDLPETIAKAIAGVLEAVFIPPNNFFDDWKDKFLDLLATKLAYDVYNDFFNNIQDISGSRLHDITVNLFGKECTIVTFKWYYDNIDDIDNFIRGATYIALIFYNINQIYRLIRGTSLYRLEKYSDKLSSSE